MSFFNVRKQKQTSVGKIGQRYIVWESNDVKPLGITLDINLKFDKYVSNVCANANRKLSALTRVVKFLPFKKRRIL